MTHHKHFGRTMLGSTIVLFVLAIGTYQPTYSQAVVARQDEAWRTSMNAFAKEVLAVAAKATIPDAAEQIKRIREYSVFNNGQGEKIWVLFAQAFEKEFHGEIVKHFQGKVTWRGLVESVEPKADTKIYVIEVKFPMPDNAPKTLEFRDSVSLSIPFAKLPTGEVPTKGSEFVFTGSLKKRRKKTLCSNPCGLSMVWDQTAERFVLV